MKGKILGILVGLMLCITYFSVAQNAEDLNGQQRQSYTDSTTNSFDDDVPIWEIGNIWTYKMDDINLDITEENLSENFKIHIHGSIDNLPFEVMDDSGDSYLVAFQATISGGYYVYIDLGDGPINITGNLEDTTIGGDILFNKSDLGIKNVDLFLSGKLTVNVNEQPYGNWSFFPEMPIPATIDVEAGFSTPFTIIDFPMNTSKFWGLPSVNITFDGTIESGWLKIFNFLNAIIRIPGVIEFISLLTGSDPAMFHEISDKLADILPVIDIGYVLNEYLGVENIIHLPGLPIVFFCNNSGDITVPAGTFNAYDINVLGGRGNIYYSPEVKNIIKIEGNFQDILPFISNINAELVSYDI